MARGEGDSSRTTKRAIWFLVACVHCAGLIAQETSQDSKAAYHAFRQRLESLAAKCEELGLAKQAQVTREWIFDRDPRRHYLFVPGHGAEAFTEAVTQDDLILKWQAKFVEVRREQAKQLFEIARQQAFEGSATSAYQLLHEVLREDPSHPNARRILGMGGDDEIHPKARAPRIAHAKFGWPRGRWWQIESPHFQITTDQSSEAGIALAHRLEAFHSVWGQLFFEYWNSAESLRARFQNDGFRNPTKPKHQIVLLRDRDEYVERLQRIEPQIKLTLGYYSKANRTSYFYHGDESLLPVWYHEATHQLFQESGDAIASVGEKWNFWVVEGIAVYMESTAELSHCYTVGGFDSDRLQFVRSRVLSGESQMPMNELARLGREDLQQHPEIRRLYSHAAGLVHFLMDSLSRQVREEFVQLLLEVYVGRDKPDSWRNVTALTSPRFDEDWREFLTVHENDLRYLGPASRRRNLSLLKAKITDESLAALATSNELEWLDLSLTPISAAGMRKCGTLKSLRRLSLVGTKVDDGIAPILAGYSQLEELDLSGTAITDKCVTACSQLRNLKVLRLSHTAVMNEGVMQLGSLQKLEELDVENTKVTSQAINELKSRLPNLK